LCIPGVLHAAATDWYGQSQRASSSDRRGRKRSTAREDPPRFHFKTPQAGMSTGKSRAMGLSPASSGKARKGSRPDADVAGAHALRIPGTSLNTGTRGNRLSGPGAIGTERQSVHIAAAISYLTCNTACVPYKYAFSLDLPVGKLQTDPEPAKLIDRFLALVPSGKTDDELRRAAPVVIKNPLPVPKRRPHPGFFPSIRFSFWPFAAGLF